jgi:predicted nucleic acid-binding protein
MTYFDTSALVAVILKSHSQHKQCLMVFEETRERITCAHAFAETFSTLTAFYKVPNDVAAELILGLEESVAVSPLTLGDYKTALNEACQRGVMGGGIYDSLHATHARRLSATRIVTLNPGNFRHVAPELEIVVL